MQKDSRLKLNEKRPSVQQRDAVPASLAEKILFFRCHEWPLALDVKWVERIVAPESVRLTPVNVPEECRGCMGMAAYGDKTYSAWDLGLMLGLKPANQAWILLNLPYGKQTVALALRTGVCISVGAMAGLVTLPLPGGAMKYRKTAFSSIFQAGAMASSKQIHAAGMKLELENLWSSEEIAFADRCMRGSSAGRDAVKNGGKVDAEPKYVAV